MFLRIRTTVEKANDNFKLRKDCCGKISFSPLQKCTAALMMLAYGKATYIIDTEIRMGETTVLNTTVQFARTMVKEFGPEYPREPTVKTHKRLERQEDSQVCWVQFIECFFHKQGFFVTVLKKGFFVTSAFIRILFWSEISLIFLSYLHFCR